MIEYYLHDIESYPNFFCTTILYVQSGEKFTYEISSHKYELEQMKSKYESISGKYLISFNGIEYDDIVINWICNQNWNSHTSRQVANLIYNFSQIVVKNEQWWQNEIIKKHYFQDWIQVDLFQYWSKMLRLSKKISLKSLAVQLNYAVIQDLPYKFDMFLNEFQIEEVIHYNAVHDIGVTLKLFEDKVYWQGKPTTFRQQHKLRLDIQKNYGLICDSYDAPKIASELLLKFYCDKNGIDKKQQKKTRFEHSGTSLPLENCQFKLPIFQNLFEEMNSSVYGYSKEVIFIHKNTRIKLTYGKGGLHSVNNNESYKTNEHQKIITSDVASLYPNLCINYKLLRYPSLVDIYSNIKDERMIAKRTGDKAKNVTFKLILNSTSGIIDNKHSWLYYPEGALKMRFMGQLVLTKTIEELAIQGYQVVSANTDGIEVVVPIEREQEYYNIVDSIGNFFNLEFEHDTYKVIYYSNVNNYIAIHADNSTKKKGSTFLTTPNIGDSCNSLIIQKAVEAYFVHGVPVKDFILNKENSIFDYCISKKSAKKYTILWNREIQQRTNRYYASKLSPYLYRIEQGIKEKPSHLMKGYGVQLYNYHQEKPLKDYNINFDYYIKEANQIIAQFENQLSLF